MNSHLTDEMLTDVLSGEGSAQAHAHLDDCPACRIEVEQISGAFAQLRQQTLAWAESQRPRPAARPVLVFPRSRLAAAAVLLACVAAGGVFRVVERTPSVHQHAAGSLADDNRLLLSIDQELSTQDASPQEMYSTSTVSKTAAVRE